MTTTNFKFGVEIEFHVKASKYGTNKVQACNKVAEILRQNGVACNDYHYTHRVSENWKIMQDGSVGDLDGNTLGLEVVSPILYGLEGINEVKKCLHVLDHIVRAKVKKDCGIHVHFDAGGISVPQIWNIYKSYARNEDVFDMIMPDSRKLDNNEYCLPLTYQVEHMEEISTPNTIHALRCIIGTGRYYKVNLQSLFRQNTIEFRQHSGSLNGEKVENWIKLLYSFIQNFRNGETVDGSKWDRLNKILSGNINTTTTTTTVPETPTKIRDLRQAVKRYFTNEEVRDIAESLGVGTDLRYKDTWTAVYNRIFNNRSSTSTQSASEPYTEFANNLVPFYTARAQALSY